MTQWRLREARLAILMFAAACMGFAVVMTVTHPAPQRLQAFGLAIPFSALLVVAFIVTARRPEAPIGWALLALSLAVALNVAAGAIAAWAATSGSRGPFVTWSAIATNWTWPVTIPLLVTFLPLLFPDGLPSPRWRWVAWVAVVTTGLIAVAATVITPIFMTTPYSTNASGGCPFGLQPQSAPSGAASETVSCGYEVVNPLGFITSSQAGAFWGVGILVCLAISVAAFASLIRRTRRSTGVLRLQMRWVTPTLVAVPLSFVLVNNPLFTVPGASSSFNPLAVLALTAFFGAMGVAITRYHLYDIDRILSRTASYAIVTGLLLGVYGLIVISATRLLGHQSPVVVASATLAAAALARPALRRVQTVVDRRFNRSRYDARLVVEGYGHRLHSQAQMHHVAEGLVDAVNETVAPSSVTLWVRP
jgi:MFS family permease